ncbi:MAG: tetratricopeptide repeat protein [Gammaproteobacteria bacterium]
MQIKRARGGVLFLLFAFLSTSVLADELLKRAEQLINEKKAQAAYELLIAESEQRSGSPDYDLLLGIAALDSGKPTMAVFAFERVLAVQPDNAHARSELARAYFEMGENEAAQVEFKAIDRSRIPASVGKTIDAYLSEIDNRFASLKRRISSYIEAAFGYDSNTNSATDSSTIAVPAFGNLLFTLDKSAQERDSPFFQLGAGSAFYAPFLNRDDLTVYGAANLQERITVDEPAFRTRIADGQVGLSYTRGKSRLRLSLLGQRFYFGGEINRDQYGGSLQWLYAYDKRTQFSAFTQGVAQRFPGQSVRNVNQYSGGIGIVHALARQGNPVVFASAFGGADIERSNSREDIGRKFAGVRIGGQYNLSEKMQLLGNLSYQYSRYGADDPLFQKTRRDNFVLTRLAIDYNVTRHWRIQPEIQYLLNDSRLVINDFDRWQLFVSVRNNF